MNMSNGSIAQVTAEPDNIAESEADEPNIVVSNPVMKSHAGLMILAFTVFIPIGNIISRHFKIDLSHRSSIGLTTWFQLHRSFQIVGVVVSTAAFIEIFVEVNGYSYLPWSPDYTHPILGITAMALLYINMILGFLHAARKNCRAARGRFWGVVHAVIGNATIAVGATAIVVAILMQSMGMPTWCTVFPVLNVVLHIVMNEILSRVNCDSTDDRPVEQQPPIEKSVESGHQNPAVELNEAPINLNYSQTLKMSAPEPVTNSSIRVVLLVFYCVMALLFAIANLVCIIVLC